MKAEFHERPTSPEDMAVHRGKYDEIWARMLAMKPGSTLIVETNPGHAYRVRQSISVRMSRDRNTPDSKTAGYITRKLDDRSFMVIRVESNGEHISTNEADE